MRQSGRLSISLVASVLFVVRVSSYPYYQTYIPNGNRVPNPCDRSQIWQGVGHRHPGGAGDRNPFGLDFASKNHNWTAVCSLDSDEDGLSNGMELGDPTCKWQMGQPQTNVTNVTHPGVCEPLDSAKCRSVNSWLTCPSPFNCPAIQQPEVENISIRLPVTPVPTEQTTYMCYALTLPNDKDYHVIALTPTITNAVVDHHMLLYVCKSPPQNADVFMNSTVCEMDVWGCLSLIGIWSVGLNGQCLSNEYGFRIGLTGYKYAVLQVHLNNPFGQMGGDNFVDSSGFTIFYTPRLRQYDGAILRTGQIFLDIPPQQQSLTFVGGCSGLCTAALPGPINIASAILHMHLLGQAGEILIIRRGGSVVVLTNETAYDYNSPTLQSYYPSIPFQPGDQFQVTCNYNSMSRTSPTYYGLSTTDEMCYGFITYYPANEDFGVCEQWRTVNGYCIAGFVDCDLPTYMNVTQQLQYICQGYSCPDVCRSALQVVVNTGCMSGEVGRLFQFENPTGISSLLDILFKCGVSIPSKYTTTAAAINTTTPSPTTTATAAAAITQTTTARPLTIRQTNAGGRLLPTFVTFIAPLMFVRLLARVVTR